jgi:uroporphyrinogen-III decarboxylase
MTSRERMAATMRHEQPDRVPVMCQLALGHYFLNTEYDEVDIWHDTAAFGDALIALQRRYGFDGILINLPGRDPDWRNQVRRIEQVGEDRHIIWKNDWVTIAPPNDNPHVYQADRETRYFPLFDEIEPDRLYYIEPHDLSGITYPYSWGFGNEPAPRDDFFPPWHWDTIRYVRERAADVSVHGEVFSPFTQFMELLDYVNGLMALMDDPGKVRACLDALAAGTIEVMRGQALAGADAVLISSAFAGAGLISPQHYREFVMPYERAVIAGFHDTFPDVPVYTHTCGAIGDRLELLEQTGTNGIDTLDPPPLGNVDLADAKERIGARLFIKGNMDPVNTVLMGTPEQVFTDAVGRVETGKPGGGYILSTACSVAPAASPENILQLRAAVEAAGWY